MKPISKSKNSAPENQVTVTIEGKALSVPEGYTIAAAMLANDSAVCRTTHKSNSPRGPYCMMGVCFECLVNVDGNPNVQGCMTSVREGMRIERQLGLPAFPGYSPSCDFAEL